MLKLRAEKFVEGKHKFLLDDFLRARGMPPADLEFLPPNGCVVYNFDQPVCIGFLIISDNKTAECSDFVSDPRIPKMIRNEAVTYMRKCFEKVALNNGIRCMIAYCEHLKHVQRLNSLGYKIFQTKLTHLGRFLWL